MREITLQDGKKINVRGLTRKELRNLKKEGVNLLNRVKNEDPEKEEEEAENIVNKVFSMILKKEEIEALDNMEFRYTKYVHHKCILETYGAVEEEKNSEAT